MRVLSVQSSALCYVALISLTCDAIAMERAREEFCVIAYPLPPNHRSDGTPTLQEVAHFYRRVARGIFPLKTLFEFEARAKQVSFDPPVPMVGFLFECTPARPKAQRRALAFGSLGFECNIDLFSSAPAALTTNENTIASSSCRLASSRF